MGRKAPSKRSALKRPPRRSPSRATSRSPETGPPGETEAARPFPIVGIGASAGGLEAFSQLLRELPVDTGMAFVLVQHLDPTHESRLTEVLSRTTAMPVVTVTDRLRVEPNYVYVIPPNAEMSIVGGILVLTRRAKLDHHLPIDHFFRSLAQEQQGRAIGVVLSGNGSDGTLGLKAIKAEGGITFVQEEQSAKYPSMPHNASAAADSALPPDGIARELVRISHHPYVNYVAPPPADSRPQEGDGDISAILRALRAVTGVDFAPYKLASIRRRIARRMLLRKVDDVKTYVRQLRETPEEAQALHDDLLIQVTGFFRDPEGFDALKRTVFPVLLKDRLPDETIRIWVPGCATGEEAYSLVISLLEFLGDRDSTVPIQMFATDLGAQAIARARAGTFPESIASEMSPDRLRRFFVKTDGRYRISKAIRDACVFALQDLTRDPPFSKLDLVSCCNVLIYLGQQLQDRIIPIFHYALKPTGFLKLGSAESVGRFGNLFETLDRKHRIYARKPGVAVHLGFGLTAGDGTAAPAAAVQRGTRRNEIDIEKEADRVVLARYAPAGVVVNADMEIVQVRGKTGPYLEATPGAASLNLFKMAREGLLFALREAVHKASRGGSPVRAEGLRVKANGGLREVDLEVIPIGPGEGAKGHHHYLILFDERPRGGAPAPEAPREREARGKTATERRAAQLARELAAARQHLQAVTEEHEAAMEELRAATEEVQSSNEELQSTNEELETAKEELQATNEELTTVNDELNSRNLELGQLSNDLGNLLGSVQVPIIMVGADLRIRRMTPVTERFLNVAPSDIGRPIGDLKLSVEVPDLEALLREVMETLATGERDVEVRDGRWYSVRVRPYRTSDNKIDGAVISFIDIDALKRGLDHARQARDQAQAIVETVREPLVILDADLHVVTANRSFYETFRVTPPDTEHQSLFELGNRQWNIPRVRALLEEMLALGNVLEDFEVEHDFETIGRRTMILNARRVLSAPGGSQQILLAIADVTELRRLEAARGLLERERTGRLVAEEATRAKDHFLAILSHELRTPLTAMLGWVRMLRTQKLDQAAAVRALEVIERNTVLQARLIEDLLDVSRIITGSSRLEGRPIMVAPPVEAAITALSPTADAKGVRLERQLDGSAGPVRGDPARLQQIVTNLVANAIKFTPSGGLVEVRVARNGARAQISVRDTGKGIAADQLPQIFTRFDAARTSPHPQGGLGLGLAIVHHLVELHGGAIAAESAGPGQGATFTVTLPLTDERPSVEADAQELTARALADRLPALNGVRVLVVDDEGDTRELVRAVLERCGAEITAVATVEAALEAIDRARPDVLVSDLAMPDQNGYDLIRKVRALDPDGGRGIPALALTAYARIEDREQALSAGYHQYLAKPIEPAELAAAVAALAGRAERKRDGLSSALLGDAVATRRSPRPSA